MKTDFHGHSNLYNLSCTLGFGHYVPQSNISFMVNSKCKKYLKTLNTDKITCNLGLLSTREEYESGPWGEINLSNTK